MTTDALISDAVYDWVLDVSDIARPAIEFAPATSQSSAGLLARYGAIATRVDGWTLVAGGVTSKGCLSQSDQIVRFDARRAEHERLERLDYATKLDPDTPRPIFTGASIIATDDGDIVLVGGGVSLLSTSAEWSRGVYSFNARALSSNDGSVPNNSRAQPVVFEGLDLGPCLTLWGLPYLADRFGPERKIVVHDSTSQAMDFLAKNFRYATQTFKEFSDNVDAGKKLYLRALSTDSPSDTPARLDTDFPTISRDFILPPQLAFVQDRLFSSVLRVSGPVNMWLHYDGTKRFCLFPPSDVTHLGFAPGASSSSIDVFSSLASSSLSHCHPYEAILAPGDVLFLPQLWLHTATPVSSSSIAVNVFFRDLDKGYSSGRDVYGNRDLAAYEKARQDVSRICKSFKDLPRDTRQFYLSRVADELQQIAAD
ncbi:tRNA methyltransferase ppm2 [Sporothrix epigloea]|uniref:tRNA methyltransferase ppm2 n=1 Tax=Sporothrix epigloea TaxID=1892477 RepID=A0ABP0D9W6_9PEZI